MANGGRQSFASRTKIGLAPSRGSSQCSASRPGSLACNRIGRRCGCRPPRLSLAGGRSGGNSSDTNRGVDRRGWCVGMFPTHRRHHRPARVSIRLMPFGRQSVPTGNTLHSGLVNSRLNDRCAGRAAASRATAFSGVQERSKSRPCRLLTDATRNRPFLHAQPSSNSRRSARKAKDRGRQISSSSAPSWVPTAGFGRSIFAARRATCGVDSDGIGCVENVRPLRSVCSPPRSHEERGGVAETVTWRYSPAGSILPKTSPSFSQKLVCPMSVSTTVFVQCTLYRGGFPGERTCLVEDADGRERYVISPADYCHGKGEPKLPAPPILPNAKIPGLVRRPHSRTPGRPDGFANPALPRRAGVRRAAEADARRQSPRGAEP